jgi:uncharacterized membrane protein YkgB
MLLSRVIMVWRAKAIEPFVWRISWMSNFYHTQSQLSKIQGMNFDVNKL